LSTSAVYPLLKLEKRVSLKVFTIAGGGSNRTGVLTEVKPTA
jgi:hypothetical protein